MFIPIGHDQAELGRWPIVSFAIILICFAVYVLQPELSKDEIKWAGGDLVTALKFYIENPDLTLPARAQQALEQFLMMQEAGVRRQLRKEIAKAEPKPDRETRQAKLDKLTDSWLSTVMRSPVWRWGLVPASYSNERLLTHMFVHLGFLHLFFNMLFLYMTGPFIEDVWGRPLFAAFYLAAGMVAAGIFAAQDPGLDAPLVGASGAIAGVMGAFLVRYPTAKIKFLNFILFYRFTFSAPAWLMLPLWFLGELVHARASTSYSSIGGAQVAYWVHVWGFSFGVVVASVVRLFNLEERFLFDAIENRRHAARDPFQHQIEQLLKRGQPAEACQMLAAEILRNPANSDIAALYWQLAQLGPMRTQPAVCLRIIQNDLLRGDDLLAIERWRELNKVVPAATPDAGLAVVLGKCLVRHGHRDEAQHLVEDAAPRIGPATPPEAVIDFARFAMNLESPLASEIVQRALANPRVSQEAKADLRHVTRWKAMRVE